LTQLNDFDFSVDLALLSRHYSQIQDKTTCLETTSTGTGLKIDKKKKKKKLMKINTIANTPITVSGLSAWVYIVRTTSREHRDITERISKVRGAFVICCRTFRLPNRSAWRQNFASLTPT
jgi:hypothetical protein